MESDPLEHIPLFAPLSSEQRGELSGLLKLRRFTAGEHIVWVGEPGVEFFIIHHSAFPPAVSFLLHFPSAWAGCQELLPDDRLAPP